MYNNAEIDGFKVDWARDMGQANDAGRLGCYRDRTAWMVEAGSLPPKRIPCEAIA